MAKTFTSDSITQDLIRTGTCNIPGIGKIKVHDRKARVGRNPATGGAIDIPAKKVLKFVPSSTITGRLNDA